MGASGEETGTRHYPSFAGGSVQAPTMVPPITPTAEAYFRQETGGLTLTALLALQNPTPTMSAQYIPGMYYLDHWSFFKQNGAQAHTLEIFIAGCMGGTSLITALIVG